MIRVPTRAGGFTLLLGLLLASLAQPALAAKKTEKAKSPAAAAPAPAERVFSRDLPDPPGPGTLPADYVMLRVADKSIGAREYVDAYFSAYAADRPNQDSLGRVAFMKALITKELMALEARRVNKPPTFEDRFTLREHSQRVYSNVLYQRVVLDPVSVTDEEVRQAHALMSTEVHLRLILFGSRETAERVRRELLTAKIGWATAVQRYSLAEKENDGDIGWQSASQIGMGFAPVTHKLKAGEISAPIRSRDGWCLVQCTERRDVRPPAFEAMRELLRAQLTNAKSNLRADGLQDSLAAQISLVIDTTNVRWAASQFQASNAIETDGSSAPMLTLNAALPEISPDDTSRVLARFRGGQITLGSFLHEFGHLPPLMRPNVNEFSAMRGQVIATAVDPFTIQLAMERGMDKDPLAVRLVERKREELMVGHLYDDSVGSKIVVSPDSRRRYYDENRHKFYTSPLVTFAAITRSSRAGIDSVAARIRAGETPTAILESDSLSGRVSGSVQTRFQNDEGRPYHKVLFDELRPGKFWIGGPDRAGDFVLIHLIARDDGRLVSFDEALNWIDETMQNERAERLLDGFIERLAVRYQVSWRPDLVMRTDFKAPKF